MKEMKHDATASRASLATQPSPGIRWDRRVGRVCRRGIHAAEGLLSLGRLGVLAIGLIVGLASTQSSFAQPDATPPEATDDEVEVGKMTEGRVPVIDFLKFIQQTTGLMVQYPSVQEDDSIWGQGAMINVLGDVEPLSYAVVKSILETNGYSITHARLEDGTEVINMSHARDRATREARVTDIVAPEEPVSAVNPEILTTMVLQLKFADTQVVANALRDLVGGSGGGGNRGGTSGSVQIVQVPSSQTLIIKSKNEILSHMKELVQYIDVEVDGPEPILEIVGVYNADAEELVQTISEILNIQGGVVGRTNRTGNNRRNTGNNNNAPVARQQQGQGEYTRLIADFRTQKIIIDTTSETQLQLILQLIDELDIKRENLRPNTHLYKVKFLKASDLAEDIRTLVEGTQRSGGSLRGNNRNTRGRTSNTANTGGQQTGLATRIVPHDDTNSLLIQADYEEYLEIVRVLEGIDRKRKQVFLEAALVQVNEGSSLNYTLEYLAGDLDNDATRAAALTAFGLSTPVFTDNPLSISRAIDGTGATGLLAAVSREGQLPVLLRAIKSDSDSRVLATPFILADDNETSDITSNTTVFFETTTSTNTGTSTGQGETEAGITLSLTPTISENVVLINLSMSVSSFGSGSSGSGSVPDRSDNTINSQVTLADGELFIIGGLVREMDSIAIDKVPILGDLPLIGRLFQSRSSTKTRNNLYIFLNAHILRDDNFGELKDLSEQGLEGVHSFGDDFRTQFESPKQRSGRDGNR